MSSRGRTALLALGALVALGGCEPLHRRLVVVLDESVADRAVLVEVVIMRTGDDPEGPAQDAAPDALPADASIDGAPDASPPEEAPPRTCRELLARTGEVDFPEALAHVTFTPDETVDLGPFAEGRVLVLVRARDADCQLAQTCHEVELEGRNESEVRIEVLEFLPEEVTCPARYRCEAGQCAFCGGCCLDVECNDEDPRTTDVCAAGACRVADDLDEDGVAAPVDCDDRIWEAHPDGFPACGYNLDHDCDGLVDELDGCGVPRCWLGNAMVLQPYPELRAQALAPFGGLVVAALSDDSNGIRLWVGSLDDGRLNEVGWVRIEGTAGGGRPQDLAIYHEQAFVLTSRPQGVAIVDLSSPGRPVHVGTIQLDRDRLSQSISISPPLLWVSRFGGHDVFDISQVGTEWGWPDALAVAAPLAGYMAIAYALQVRGGQGYVISDGSTVHCFGMTSPVDFPLTSSECFTTASLAHLPELHNTRINAFFVTSDRTIVAASRSTDTAQPALWAIPTDDQGQPVVEGVRVAYTMGEPRAVVVAGGTIVRSTSLGLSLHSRAAFDTPLVTYVDFDEDPATNGPAAWETLVFGTTAIAAVEGVGLVTLELSCVE